MRELSAEFQPYPWEVSTAQVARIAGILPAEVLRFDDNTSAGPPLAARYPATLSTALGHVHGYPHGGYPELVAAIAAYAGVNPENIVLGAGADDLILLVARSFVGPGDCVAIIDEPTYPLFRVATWLAGAEVGDQDPQLTFCCRPHNPTGGMGELPPTRPLVVDEAYYEYCGETAALLDDGIVVIRTLSKAFGLAGARVGYAIADHGIALELNARQTPAPISTLSAALAVAVLAEPPNVQSVVEERERLAGQLRELGLSPLPSSANFLYIPLGAATEVSKQLLARGIVVRLLPTAIRITVLDADSNKRLIQALEPALDAVETA